MPAAAFAQDHTGLGIGIGVYDRLAASFEIIFQVNDSRVHLGFSSGPPGTEGIHIEDAPGGDLTDIGHGSVTTTGDIGYSRFLTKRFNMGLTFSIGARNYYTNYINDVGEKGFYFYSKRLTAGGGVHAGFFVSKMLELYIGYSSLRQAGGGLRVTF